jgi:hypothetical protein
MSAKVEIRVAPQNIAQRNQKKVDRQLIQMLLIQSFLFGSTISVYSISNLYVLITNSLMVKDDLEKKRRYFSRICGALGNYCWSLFEFLSFHICSVVS